MHRHHPMGTTNGNINSRLLKHKINCGLGYAEISAVAEHTHAKDYHRILSENKLSIFILTFLCKRVKTKNTQIIENWT